MPSSQQVGLSTPSTPIQSVVKKSVQKPSKPILGVSQVSISMTLQISMENVTQVIPQTSTSTLR